MTQWLADNPVPVITMAAAVLAALAAVWSAIVSHRQLRITRASQERPTPIVSIEAYPVKDQVDWSELMGVVRNRADVPLEVVTVSSIRAERIRFLSDADARESDWAGGELPLCPLPAEKAAFAVPIGTYVNVAGSQKTMLEWGQVARFRCYAHLPLQRWSQLSRPSIILTLRWRDQAATTFTIAARVTSASNP